MSTRSSAPTPILPAELEAVVRRLCEALPQLSAVILFGSQASSLADEFSDYDLIVLLPDGLDRTERRALEGQLRAEFPSLNLDLVVGSERSLLASLRYEPARRFWLENGIALWGRKPSVFIYPPLARGALLSHLDIIQAEVAVADADEDDRSCCRISADALEHLLQIEYALAGNYSNATIRQALINLLGHELAKSIRTARDPAQPVDPAACRHLLKITRARLRALREKVSAMPENESDRLWREQWQRDEPAKAA